MSEVRAVRRIVTIEDNNGKEIAFSDGPSPDVMTDLARPGYSETRLWVTDQTPAKIKGVTKTLGAPRTIEPPAGGSVSRMVTFPPDSSCMGNIGAQEVKAYFAAAGSPGASTYSADGPHPFMQETETLDFCIVMEGKITLVLDTEEVALKEGDSVVQRGRLDSDPASRNNWSERANTSSLALPLRSIMASSSRSARALGPSLSKRSCGRSSLFSSRRVTPPRAGSPDMGRVGGSGESSSST